MTPHLIGLLLFISYSGKPLGTSWGHLGVLLPSVLLKFSDLSFSWRLQQLLSELLFLNWVPLLDDFFDSYDSLRDGFAENFLQEITIRLLPVSDIDFIDEVLFKGIFDFLFRELGRVGLLLLDLFRAGKCLGNLFLFALLLTSSFPLVKEGESLA